jgi:hypothetical protein
MTVDSGIARARQDRALGTRIDRMFSRDRVWAWGFIVVLWAVVIYVAFATIGMIEDGAVKAAILISGALVLLFNTASIAAMVRHYSHDKDFIYGLDIRHLDERRERK